MRLGRVTELADQDPDRKGGAIPPLSEESAAENRELYLVAVTLFLPAGDVPRPSQ